VLLVSTVLVLLSMMLMSFADTGWMLMTGVTMYGLAQGMTSPTLLAWATDLSDEQHRGRALASLYIFMELGIGIGAFVSGWFLASDATNFFLPFLASGLFGGLAFLILLVKPLSAVR
jgi:MFS family permease